MKILSDVVKIDFSCSVEFGDNVYYLCFFLVLDLLALLLMICGSGRIDEEAELTDIYLSLVRIVELPSADWC